MIMRNIDITRKVGVRVSTTETPLFLSFSTSKAVTQVTVYITGEEVPDALDEDEMHAIPVQRGTKSDWLINMQDAVFMGQMINGVLDGEVIPQYAKYALWHMAIQTEGMV